MLTIRAVARLVAHQSVVALFCLEDCRGLEVVLVEPEGNLVDAGQVVVELANINIATFHAVAVRIQGVRLPRLLIGEGAKVLGPVAHGGSGVLEGVRASNVVGSGEALVQQAVVLIVGMPPHLHVRNISTCRCSLSPILWKRAYVVLVRFLAVEHLGTLDNIIRRDVFVALNGFCSQHCQQAVITRRGARPPSQTDLGPSREIPT